MNRIDRHLAFQEGAYLGPDTYQNASMDDWQRGFLNVYHHKDHGLRMHDMMTNLVIDVTRLSESVRKGHYEDTFMWIPRAFSWLSSLGTAAAMYYPDLSPLGWSLAEIIWNKYPGICSLCAKAKCECPTWDTDKLAPAERRAIEIDRRQVLEDARRHKGGAPTTLDQWLHMFDDVYGTINATRPLSTKALHLWEEIGELSVELRSADRRAAGLQAASKEEEGDGQSHWEEELADVFSWLFSVHLHITNYTQDASRLLAAYEAKRSPEDASASAIPIEISSFAEWVWHEASNRTRLWCHRCKGETCSCELNFERR